jgi:hypothetical protein
MTTCLRCDDEVEPTGLTFFRWKRVGEDNHRVTRCTEEQTTHVVDEDDPDYDEVL